MLKRIAVPRLSAFFGSTPGQDPKAAKFAVLSPGRAGFPNRAKRSEGSDTSHVSHTRKDPERMAYKPQFRQKKKDHAAQRGRDASEQRHA